MNDQLFPVVVVNLCPSVKSVDQFTAGTFSSTDYVDYTDFLREKTDPSVVVR